MNRKTYFLALVASIFFAISGTSIAQPPPGDYDPVLAFDPEMNRYLAVYSSSTAVFDTLIKGVFVESDGVKGEPFDISSPNGVTYAHFGPSVAYDSINRRFLVVWHTNIESGSTGEDLNGRFVNQTGVVAGDSFSIINEAEDQDSQKIAYDGKNQRFLVTCLDYSTGNSEVFGVLLDKNGAAINSAFNISNTVSQEYEPSILYIDSREAYFVAWTDTSNNIVGKFIDKDGTVGVSTVNLSTNATAGYSNSIAWDETDDRLLAVWADTRTSYHQDIFGQIADFDSFTESNFAIYSASDIFKEQPRVSFDEGNGRFLVAWLDNHSAPSPKVWNPKALSPKISIPYHAYAVYVSPTGEIEGDSFPIVEDDAIQNRIELGYNSNCHNFVASLTNRAIGDSAYSVDFKLVGDPCSNPPTAPELKYPLDGATGVNTNVTLKWNKSDDPDGDKVSYSVLLCADENFAGCENVEVASLAKTKDGYAMAGFGGISALFFAALAFSTLKIRKRGVASVLFLVIAGYLLVISGCGSSGTSYNAKGLAPATKYYWKVSATDGKGGISQSETWSFTTK